MAHPRHCVRVAAALLVLLPAVAGVPQPVGAQTVAEPEGYRGEPYRGPVPETLTGGTVLTTGAAQALWEGGTAVFVDVLPRAPRPANLPKGTLWRDKPRLSIPGSVWLPNVGYEKLAPETEDYFRAGLELASGGDRDKALVFFCLEECWMSWNAARRAVEFGYRSVSWYPEGTDGWAFEDLPLKAVEPLPPPE